MNPVDELFNRMDCWRNLPSYQLERRADLFFSLYIPQVIEAVYAIPTEAQLIPEFPVRIGAIFPDIRTNKSYKIDYVAISQCGRTAFFVELKTEPASRRESQDAYLRAANAVGFPALLQGVCDIFGATTAKSKYFYLLQMLDQMQQLKIPDALQSVMARPHHQGANAAARQIEIITTVERCEVVYIQPHAGGEATIDFERFAQVVGQHDDPISIRFAESLARWSQTKAGHANLSRICP